MSSRTEGMLAIVAALMVLISAFIHPLASTAVAVIALVALGVYHIIHR